MKLPLIERPGQTSPEAFPWLIVGPEGVGKTSLLASQQLWLKENGHKPAFLLDPMVGARAHSVVGLELGSWAEHLEFCTELELAVKRGDTPYSWLQLDLLNVSYDWCYDKVLQEMKLRAPAESRDMGSTWNIITRTFVRWFRRLAATGIPIIATVHANYVEFKKKGGVSHHRAIPFFVGGGGTSTYSHMMKSFDIIGFMTNEAFEIPISTMQTHSTISKAVDVRKDAAVTREEDRRVMHFYLSDEWIAKPGRFMPEKVLLPTDWRKDWHAVVEAWTAGVEKERVNERG